MSTHPSLPDDLSADLDPVKAKQKRAQDAEQIRQDFIKSHRSPDRTDDGPKPSPDSNGE
jgi:hypothetical protein